MTKHFRKRHLNTENHRRHHQRGHDYDKDDDDLTHAEGLGLHPERPRRLLALPLLLQTRHNALLTQHSHTATESWHQGTVLCQVEAAKDRTLLGEDPQLLGVEGVLVEEALEGAVEDVDDVLVLGDDLEALLHSVVLPLGWVGLDSVPEGLVVGIACLGGIAKIYLVSCETNWKFKLFSLLLIFIVGFNEYQLVFIIY